MTLLLGTVLFVVLGVSALVWTIVIDAPATAQSNPGAESEVIARRFYDALNSAVRTDDLTLLDHVAVTNSEHMPGVLGTGCDLRCRVSALHHLDPGLRLGVDDVLVDGDRVAARFSIQGNDRPVFLGLPLRGNLAPWPQVDVLRVGDGQIVEVQTAGDLPTLVELLGHTALEALPPAPYRLGLVRLSIEPGTAITETWSPAMEPFALDLVRCRRQSGLKGADRHMAPWSPQRGVPSSSRQRRLA